MAVSPADADAIGRLEEVFEQAARAVVTCQAGLEQRQAPSAALVYSMPRVDLDLEFGLEWTAGRRILLRRRRTRTSLAHRLRFALVAAPRRPPPPPAAYAREILQPDFLVPGGEQKALRERLARDLARPGRWTFRPRPADDSVPGFRNRVSKESARVAASDALVYFRLPGLRVLAVRVADGSTGKKDGLYVVDPEGEVPVAVFNFDGDGVRGIRWEPLALLAARLRAWHAAGEPRERTGVAAGHGFEGPRAFVDGLLTGIGRGLSFLARPAEARPAEVEEGLLPVFYDLEGVEAAVSFAVSEADPEVRLDVAPLAAEADAGVDDVPSSLLRIAVDAAADPPRLTVELAELEFVLAGDDRRRAIDQIAAAAVDVDAVMSGGGQVRRWIADPDRQARAVVLRWFRRRERLLAIWPGRAGDDFAFACERRHGTRLRSFEPVKASGVVRSLVDDAARDVLHYAPFHRFFQAVLAWQRRGV